MYRNVTTDLNRRDASTPVSLACLIEDYIQDEKHTSSIQKYLTLVDDNLDWSESSLGRRHELVMVIINPNLSTRNEIQKN